MNQAEREACDLRDRQAQAIIRAEVRRLENAIEAAEAQHESDCGRLFLDGGPDDLVAETERELDLLRRDLQRARAAAQFFG